MVFGMIPGLNRRPAPFLRMRVSTTSSRRSPLPVDAALALGAVALLQRLFDERGDFVPVSEVFERRARKGE